jgi:hypothetical protein
MGLPTPTFYRVLSVDCEPENPVPLPVSPPSARRDLCGERGAILVPTQVSSMRPERSRPPYCPVCYSSDVRTPSLKSRGRTLDGAPRLRIHAPMIGIAKPIGFDWPSRPPSRWSLAAPKAGGAQQRGPEDLASVCAVIGSRSTRSPLLVGAPPGRIGDSCPD